MTRKFLVATGLALLATLALSTAASAAVTFDPDTGTGFVGKGDVQLIFGWNNKQLQDGLAGVSFRYQSVTVTVTEVSWECTKSQEGKEDKIQERERTTTSTSSINGIVSAVARVKNQTTGVNLNGYSSSTQVNTVATEGPAVDSCPNSYTLTTPVGAPVELSSETSGVGLEVSSNGTDWYQIPAPIVV